MSTEAMVVSSSMNGTSSSHTNHHGPAKLKLLDLSDDLIFGIAFTGYLGFTLKSIQSLLLTCKQLHRISRYQVGLFQYHESFTEEQWEIILKSLQQFISVSCVDLSYSRSDPWSTVGLFENLKRWSSTLYGLNFKDTLIDDLDLKQLAIASSENNAQENIKFNQLRFLDLSKVRRDDRTLITDEGMSHFLHCRQMKWLNLGMTDITDAMIEQIVMYMPYLEYLSIPSCHKLTNACLHHLKKLSLVVLDISFCKGLTLDAFQILFGNR
jgi:hypothetical protein